MNLNLLKKIELFIDIAKIKKEYILNIIDLFINYEIHLLSKQALSETFSINTKKYLLKMLNIETKFFLLMMYHLI